MATRFTRDGIKQLRWDVEQALAPLEKHWDAKFKLGTIRFRENSADIKVSVSLVGDSGIVQTREREAFIKSASQYGLKSAWLDQEFCSSGSYFRITGLSTRRLKYPVDVERRDGKPFKFSAILVAQLMRLVEYEENAPTAPTLDSIKERLSSQGVI